MPCVVGRHTGTRYLNFKGAAVWSAVHTRAEWTCATETADVCFVWLQCTVRYVSGAEEPKWDMAAPWERW